MGLYVYTFRDVVVMTIGAVSLTNYSASLQSQYFGTTVSADRIKDLLNEYGIQTTGDASIDMQNLYEAMFSAASNSVKNTLQQNSQPEVIGNSANVPWAALMSQVGLSLTGDINTDYNAFMQKIFSLQLSATSPQDQANMAQLQAEADIVFVQSTTSQDQSSPQASGADILAQLNKMYLMG